MAADSTEAGYLAPTPPGPLNDLALEDLFQQVVVSLTGLPGNLVRPRWQPNPPNQPSAETDWIAIGVSHGETQWDAYQRFEPLPEPGSYIVEGTEVLRANVSFYGPNNEAVKNRLLFGLQVSQNRDALEVQKIKYQGAGSPVNLPALLKEYWTLRVDVTLNFTRWVTRTYPIKTLQRAGTDLNNEFYVTPISVNPPSP